MAHVIWRALAPRDPRAHLSSQPPVARRVTLGRSHHLRCQGPLLHILSDNVICSMCIFCSGFILGVLMLVFRRQPPPLTLRGSGVTHWQWDCLHCDWLAGKTGRSETGSSLRSLLHPKVRRHSNNAQSQRKTGHWSQLESEGLRSVIFDLTLEIQFKRSKFN